jgi:alpha-amylase/alpha-mannosidase (GH57 family)
MVYVAFFWHHHQPYYANDISGETALPWVRLHAVKDYTGMALHLREFPGVKAAFNFVPSLLKQLIGLGEGKALDTYFLLSKKDAASLDRKEADFIIENFFSANWDTMVRPYPRYMELLGKRGFGARDPDLARADFSAADLRDLQVWFNLTWFHPMLRETDALVHALFEKGRGFTEDEKQALLEKQLEVVRGVIPLYRELAGSGQVELTTSPFYHPILPLLFDMRSAHDGLPGTALPEGHHPLVDDAFTQIDRGIELHRELFGEDPVGMWPPEGSVSEDIIEPLASRGIRWIATDESILAASEGAGIMRNGYRNLLEPERLYRPRVAASGGRELAVVFRDQVLSNAIGFEYRRSDGSTAVRDFFEYLSAVKNRSHGKPLLVPVILDGENAWEYYPEGAVSFFRGLYKRLESEPNIRTIRVRDYIDEFPPDRKLPKLFAGSWVNGNFYTWIGHKEDVAAWEAVFKARKALESASSEGRIDDETLKAALEEIYIAEGSDWYWWYGDDHSSDHDPVFDAMFRAHLANVYTLAGLEVPFELARPIMETDAGTLFEPPTGFLRVTLDGRVSDFFEWLGAGRYDHLKAGGAMDKGASFIDSVLFGFDKENLFLRVDFAEPERTWLAEGGELRVVFVEPVERVLVVRPPAGEDAADFTAEVREKTETRTGRAKASLGRILEIACPLPAVGVALGERVLFFIEIVSSGKTMEKVPLGNPLFFDVPAEEFGKNPWL